MVGLEAVGLDLAGNAGLAVPAHELRTLGNTLRRALLVERFDTTGGSGRRHMISLRTLCKERPGAYVQKYTELAEAVRQVSAEPQARGVPPANISEIESDIDRRVDRLR